MACSLIVSGWIRANDEVLDASRDLTIRQISPSNLLPNDRNQDASIILAAMLNYARGHQTTTLVLQPGDYYFRSIQTASNGRRANVLLEDMNHFTLDGRGARFHFSERAAWGVLMQGCNFTTLRNLSVDFDPPPFTSFTVTQVHPDALAVEVSPSRSPYPLSLDSVQIDRNFLRCFFLREGRRLATVPRLQAKYPSRDGIIDFFSEPGTTSNNLGQVRPGDTLLVCERSRGYNAIEVINKPQSRELSRGNTVESVTVHSSPGFGIHLRLQQDAHLIGCNVIPASGAPVSANADGIHVSDCGSGVMISGCEVSASADDALAINTQVWSTVAVFTEPDQITILRSAVAPFPDHTTLAIMPADYTREPTASEAQKLSEKPLPDQPGREAVTLRLKPAPPSLRAGALVFADPAQWNKGIVVEDNYLGPTIFAHALFLSGVNGALITNNRIQIALSPGISLQPASYPGFNSAQNLNVTFTRNDVTGADDLNAPGTLLEINSNFPGKHFLPPLNFNLHIVENIFSGGGTFPIKIANGSLIQIERNRFRGEGISANPISINPFCHSIKVDQNQVSIRRQP